jgi:hypothetical protein
LKAHLPNLRIQVRDKTHAATRPAPACLLAVAELVCWLSLGFSSPALPLCPPIDARRRSLRGQPGSPRSPGWQTRF